MPVDNSACRSMTSYYRFAIEWSNGSTLLIIPAYKSIWSQSALHKPECRDKTVSWLNREWQMYKCHAYLARMSKLFSWEFSMSHIFADLIEHNYWSNQSALTTRRGTDSHHQYGDFCFESQMSFSRNATLAGSEEGWLFSQAISDPQMCN